MCGIDEWVRENKYMSDYLFQKITSELGEHSDVIERVSLFLGGEALLDNKLERRISSLLNKKIKNVYFTTNASLLDCDRAKKILESGVTQVDISIDSLNREVYEKIRVHLKFDEVLENTLQFVKLRNEGDYKTRIRIRITEMLCNKHEIEQMINFWNEILDISKGDLVYAKSLNTTFISSNINDSKFSFIGVNEYLDNFSSCNLLPCYALWNTAVIFSDGRVGMCCVDMGRNFIFGDLKRQTLEDVWRNSETLLSIRAKHLKEGRGSIEVCKNCNVWA